MRISAQNFSAVDLSSIECIPCDSQPVYDFKRDLCSGDYVVVYTPLNDNIKVEIVDRVLRTQIVLCNTDRYSIATGRCLTSGRIKYLIEPTQELIEQLHNSVLHTKLANTVSNVKYSELAFEALNDILDIVRCSFLHMSKFY